MAVSESTFKLGIRSDLKVHYGEKALIWTNNDMFRVGLPDFSASYAGNLYAIEAKFAKSLPVRGTSKVLSHEVSAAQLQFLKSVRDTGNYSAVVIGLSDVCVVMLDLKENYTLDEVKAAKRIERSRGAWRIEGLFEYIRGDNG